MLSTLPPAPRFISAQPWFASVPAALQERLREEVFAVQGDKGAVMMPAGSAVEGWHAVLSGLVMLQSPASKGRASAFIGVPERALIQASMASHQEPWSQANLLSCFGPRYLNGLMLVEGRPAGFYISDLVAGDSSLMNICVHPDFQGKGLGRALLKEYLARSKGKGAEAWFLEVRVGNRTAISLYESEGFAEYCRRADYYGTGQDREDAVLMSRLFDFGYMYRFDPLRACNSNGLLTPQCHAAERFETRSYYAYLLGLEQRRGSAAALSALELEKRIALECYQHLRQTLAQRGASSDVLAWLDGIIGDWQQALRHDLARLYLREAWRSHWSDLDDDLQGQTCTSLTLQRLDWLTDCLDAQATDLQRLNLLQDRPVAAWRQQLEQARELAMAWQVCG